MKGPSKLMVLCLGLTALGSPAVHVCRISLVPLKFGIWQRWLSAGFAVGLIPAWKAYRDTLADGLSVRI